MSSTIQLWKEENIINNEQITCKIIIERDGRKINSLWYKLPAKFSPCLSNNFDPFVVATIFSAMQFSADLVVHGTVSPSLIDNLAEFQDIWQTWVPDKYTKIDIIPDREQEPDPIRKPQDAVLAFSGGADGCFTAWRHHNRSCGRLNKNIHAGVFIHGFDIPLEEKESFEVAKKHASLLLESLGIIIIPIVTNFQKLGQNWGYSHGAGLASCLMLLQNRYSYGLIGSSAPYDKINPWGSNPLTDRLLSNTFFKVVYDGASFMRHEKIAEISKWPEVNSYLRVCWEGKHFDKNCGKCEKCIRTILSFRITGGSLPKCFEQDISDEQIVRLRCKNYSQFYHLQGLYDLARKKQINEPWVHSLQRCIKINKKLLAGHRSLRRRIGSLTRAKLKQLRGK